ncbi:hypothetical protein [Rhodococcus qingshengii]|uniref:hypothetical protein n=1 Tax=Rhodococcus qingshengii TaxID=334542 RepID=UPI0022B3DC09|nr:hypothetical protein [Rhodococcus qingshengii]MCZ4618398.1 hypothetical protein [Rhodococcus qingshengii]
MAELVGARQRKKSTLRNYQGVVRDFCTYLTSPHYKWPEECEKRFGTHPVQICHEWNTVGHLVDYEGDPDRRPLNRTELQQLVVSSSSVVGIVRPLSVSSRDRFRGSCIERRPNRVR